MNLHGIKRLERHVQSLRDGARQEELSGDRAVSVPPARKRGPACSCFQGFMHQVQWVGNQCFKFTEHILFWLVFMIKPWLSRPSTRFSCGQGQEGSGGFYCPLPGTKWQMDARANHSTNALRDSETHCHFFFKFLKSFQVKALTSVFLMPFVSTALWLPVCLAGVSTASCKQVAAAGEKLWFCSGSGSAPLTILPHTLTAGNGQKCFFWQRKKYWWQCHKLAQAFLNFYIRKI